MIPSGLQKNAVTSDAIAIPLVPLCGCPYCCWPYWGCPYCGCPYWGGCSPYCGGCCPYCGGCPCGCPPGCAPSPGGVNGSSGDVTGCPSVGGAGLERILPP